MSNNPDRFVFGDVLFRYWKNEKKITSIINSVKIQEILSMIDIYCCIPYEFTLKRLSDIEFFTIFIYQLIWIDEGGNI